MAGAWLKTLAVVRTEKEPYSLFAETFKETFERLSSLAENSHVRWSDLVKFIVSWALNRRAKEEREPLAEIAVKSQRNIDQRNEVQAMSQTIAESLIEEGELKGEMKGELKARRKMLLRFLQRKFPHKLDESASARIQAAMDLVTLENWLDASWEAESWSDFKKRAAWPKSDGDNHDD